MSDDNGQRVTTKTLDWKQLVQKRWGKEYTKPDPGYEFSNGRTFDDKKSGGPYGPQS